MEDKSKEIGEKDKKGIKNKQNKQIVWAIIIMILAILLMVVLPITIRYYMNNFTYINLDFVKEKYGEVVFYSAKVPLINNSGGVSFMYPISIRTDPRNFEKLNTSINEGDLKVLRNVKTYLVSAHDIKPCEDNIIASVGLARFLNGFGQLDVEGASNDKNYSIENNITYANCEIFPNNTVILIKSGNETKIEKTDKNCYVLSFKECEVLDVTEGFEITILKDYMNNFERKKSIFSWLPF